MAKKRKKKILVGDFETTVYEGQQDTQVWASAVVELYTEDAKVFGSIEATWEYLLSLKSDILIYYHNLGFDGTFWLCYLLGKLKLKQAYEDLSTMDEFKVKWIPNEDMPDGSIKYSISNMGKYYSITCFVKGHYIEFRDSLKLLPFSVAEIGKAFKTKHQKLEMEYEGFRYPNCYISDEEKEYIKNDVYVVKEALEFMFEQKHDSMTIGTCCMKEFKHTYDKRTYEEMFPDLKAIELDADKFGSKDVDEYIRKSYRGGWCYVVKGCENRIFKKGCVCDVNSLYPSVMHSSSGNAYPIGHPMFWKGNFIHPEALRENMYYFVRVKTRFKLKKGMLPFIQIKNSGMYKSNEYLETSDFKINGKYYKGYIDKDGNKVEARPTLTLTMTDYALFRKHCDVKDFEILDGCYFESRVGIFDDYINPWRDLKMKSTGAMRQLAKLFLNNLYGKMATNSCSSFKVVHIIDGKIDYDLVIEFEKKTGYIACGSAITSYAKNFTITNAQNNFTGSVNPKFVYADTDSIHCMCSREELVDVRIHPTDFNAWKCESYFDEAVYVRQKTYIEHITHEDEVPCEPHYDIKCAGMGKRCKELMNISLSGGKVPSDADEKEKEFLQTRRTLKDFKVGLKVPSNLKPHRIEGGILLEKFDYVMR
jgi:hypothetical protein